MHSLNIYAFTRTYKEEIKMARKKISDEVVTDNIAKEAEVASEDIEKSTEAAETPVEDSKTEEPETEESKAEEAPKKRGRPKKSENSVKFNELSPEEQIKIRADRNSYSISKADKKTKEALYERDYIVTEYGDEDYEDDVTQMKEELHELAASATNNKILKGRITSITTVATNHEPDDPDYIPAYMARVHFMHGNFDIKIPSYLLYDYNLANYNTKNGAESIRHNLTSRIGSEIKFVVRHLDEKKKEVIADRLGAMSLEGVKTYYSKTDKKPLVFPGIIVKARIVSNARDYITVEALGAEFNIMNDELSYFFVGDVRDHDGIETEDDFSIGSYVNVRIMSVDFEKVQKFNSTYTLVRATGSVKKAKKDPKEKFYDDFVVGDIWAGTVSGILDGTGIYVNISNKMQCLCQPPIYGKSPMKGDNVRVKITRKDDANKYLYGILYQY